MMQDTVCTVDVGEAAEVRSVIPAETACGLVPQNLDDKSCSAPTGEQMILDNCCFLNMRVSFPHEVIDLLGFNKIQDGPEAGILKHKTW